MFTFNCPLVRCRDRGYLSFLNLLLDYSDYISKYIVYYNSVVIICKLINEFMLKIYSKRKNTLNNEKMNLIQKFQMTPFIVHQDVQVLYIDFTLHPYVLRHRIITADRLLH